MMPEKTEKVETNGRPMPEKTVEKVEETARQYMKEAEKMGEDAFRMYNDFMTTTTTYYFDTMNNTMRSTMELTTRTEHAMEDMMAIYRRTYMEGIKSWQTYWQDINKMMIRTR